MFDSMKSMKSSLNSFNVELMDIVEFVNPDPKMLCTKCSRRLRNPCQSECGHRFCQSCLDEMILKSQGQPCPCPSLEGDCEPIVRDKVNRDASAHRDIMRAKVYCIYKKYGCEETPMFMKLQEHIENCRHVTCCQYCKERLPPDQLQAHVDKECPEVPVSCPFNCGVHQIRRYEIDEHNRTCENKPRRCKYHHMGCLYELKKLDLLLHEKEDSLHLELVLNRAALLENSFQELTNRVQTAQGESESCLQQLEVLIGDFEELKRQFLSLRDKQKLAEEMYSRQEAPLFSRLSWLQTELQGLRSRLAELSTMKAKCHELETSLQQLQTTSTPEFPAELRKTVEEHERMVGLHDIRLAEFDLRLQCAETANYRGVLIWKIGNYAARKAQAVQGSIVSLYSQPFYTRRYGYKMCARVYLNGDGIGRNTHMSLFFVVMQGDYDDILPWPFNRRVTLSLLDQVDNRQHLTDAFKADLNSSSFKKPVNAMNIASGCPVFVPHKVLEDPSKPYLRNDTVFIKVVVDTSDLTNP